MAALGVVFGDIGTSPIYALRECLAALHGVDHRQAVLGSLSLMIWLITLVVCIKYLVFVMRADNRGEGGIFALLALTRREKSKDIKVGWFALLVLAGAALLYGDGIITPAISVISAAEGLRTLEPRLEAAVPAVAAVILAGLFAVQRQGTQRIGTVFGPVMLIWFMTLAVMGLVKVLGRPEVLQALHPKHGFWLLVHHPGQASALVGAVVLAVTGAEALYADMGHFGRKPIRAGWFLVAMPGLILNYLGQGALALSRPEVEDLFFEMAGHGPWRVGLVLLTFLATVIASQALITGTYSLTRQAIQLGYFPRLKIDHTNEAHEGQIYMPAVNLLLATGSIALVLSMKSSANLAAAYGIAVTGTMAVTTLAFFRVARQRFGWKPAAAWAFLVAFLALDLACFGANLHKVADGGWIPLMLGLVVLAVMHTWKVGRGHISKSLADRELPIGLVIDDIVAQGIYRTPGAAVFMAGRPEGVPVVLLHSLKWNRCIQGRVVLLSFVTASQPSVADADRLDLEDLGHGFWRAVVSVGYMETPDAMKTLHMLQARGVPIEPAATTFYFNREIIRTSPGRTRMRTWQKRLYRALSRNSEPVYDHFRVPAHQLIELGLTVSL